MSLNYSYSIAKQKTLARLEEQRKWSTLSAETWKSAPDSSALRVETNDKKAPIGLRATAAIVTIDTREKKDKDFKTRYQFLRTLDKEFGMEISELAAQQAGLKPGWVDNKGGISKKLATRVIDKAQEIRSDRLVTVPRPLPPPVYQGPSQTASTSHQNSYSNQHHPVPASNFREFNPNMATAQNRPQPRPHAHQPAPTPNAFAPPQPNGIPRFVEVLNNPGLYRQFENKISFTEFSSAVQNSKNELSRQFDSHNLTDEQILTNLSQHVDALAYDPHGF